MGIPRLGPGGPPVGRVAQRVPWSPVPASGSQPRVLSSLSWYWSRRQGKRPPARAGRTARVASSPVVGMPSRPLGCWLYMSSAQPVNAPRLLGRAGRALGCGLDGFLCLPLRAAPRLPVVLDPIGGRGSAVVPGPVGALPGLAGAVAPGIPAASSAGVIVSPPPPSPVVLEAQLEVVIVLVSRFTAPVLASSLPWIVAAVLAVIVAEAMIVPTKLVPVPSVAEEPTCQKTLQACAPPVRSTRGFEPVISVEPIWKMKTALGLPSASSVTVPDESSSELLAVRTPGRNTWPERSVPAEPLLGRDAALL